MVKETITRLVYEERPTGQKTQVGCNEKSEKERVICKNLKKRQNKKF